VISRNDDEGRKNAWIQHSGTAAIWYCDGNVRGLSGQICHHNTSELRFHLLYWTYQQFIWFLLVMEYNFQELETLNFIHVQWVSNQKKDHW